MVIDMDLKQGLNEYISANTNDKFRRAVKLQRAWEKIAPGAVLEHTDNVVESNKQKNAVAIFVDTPHIAAELSMSKEYYRQMMELEIGEEVSNIFFIVSKATGKRKQFQKQEEKKPWYQDDCESIPLNDEELAYARLSVEGIEDEKLKETLFNALVSDMEWKKGIKAQESPQTKS